MHIQKHAPKFIGIGGKASGLAIITQLLDVHPGVSGPLPNTGLFAGRTEPNLKTYESALALTSSKPKSGECCPDYLTTRETAPRIARAYPDAKLFAVIRNPIDRAIVEYSHAKAKREVSSRVSCAQYLTNQPDSQINGFYGRHLSHYFSLYSPLQLHVLVFEDFVKDPLHSIQKLYDFLGLDKNFVPKRLQMYVPKDDEPVNPGRIKKLFKIVGRLFRKIHPKKPVALLVKPAPIQQDYFSDHELAVFKKTFAADARQLSSLLSRDMVVEWDLHTAV